MHTIYCILVLPRLCQKSAHKQPHSTLHLFKETHPILFWGQGSSFLQILVHNNASENSYQQNETRDEITSQTLPNRIYNMLFAKAFCFPFFQTGTSLFQHWRNTPLDDKGVPKSLLAPVSADKSEQCH